MAHTIEEREEKNTEEQKKYGRERKGERYSNFWFEIVQKPLENCESIKSLKELFVYVAVKTVRGV